jgi:hypothetical protein
MSTVLPSRASGNSSRSIRRSFVAVGNPGGAPAIADRATGDRDHVGMGAHLDKTGEHVVDPPAGRVGTEHLAMAGAVQAIAKAQRRGLQVDEPEPAPQPGQVERLDVLPPGRPAAGWIARQ